LPVLFLVLYISHTETAQAKALYYPRQALFFCAAVAAGCYIVHVGNEYDYYAVMKRIPALGTVCVWSVVEMGVFFGIAAVGAVASFMVVGGYSIF